MFNQCPRCGTDFEIVGKTTTRNNILECPTCAGQYVRVFDELKPICNIAQEFDARPTRGIYADEEKQRNIQPQGFAAYSQTRR